MGVPNHLGRPVGRMSGSLAPADHRTYCLGGLARGALSAGRSTGSTGGQAIDAKRIEYR